MSLPTHYYVYTHRDPTDNYKVIYVGMGSKDRAWTFRVSFSRSEEHERYLNHLYSLGYTPADWVVIEHNQLGRERAKKLEKILISSYNPPLNINKGIGSNINKDLLAKIKIMKENGMTQSEVARACGISVMSAWRYSYVY